MRRGLPALAVGLVCALVCAPGGAQERPRGPDLRAFEDAWRMVRDAFYERGMHGVDWNAARERHLPRARAARSQQEVHEVILEMLAELKVSHAAIIEEDVYRKHYDHEAKGMLAPTFGVKLARLQDGYYVADCVAGGPADAAGLLRGDRLLALNGQPPEQANLRPLPWDAGLGGPRGYVLPTEKAGERARLELQRFQRPKGMFQLTLTSAMWSELEGSRVSRRVLERHGLKVGYMRLYHVLSEEPVDLLAEFISRDLADAHGLVLDVRGQGGLPSAVDRLLDFFDPGARGGPLWGRRPVVLLVDSETRSAKEVLAFSWRRRGLGKVVGQRTRGAVLGAQFRPLPDGAHLLLPMLDMRTMTGGVVLEGKGVPPDVEVQASLPYAQGHDPILERGLEVVLDEAMIERRRGAPAGWY
ncbi:MAG: PDZ domain-containing protein [Planctomycetes bacterium]|nr:PDZ domain-containing protein [Planctomycetota bacterium]